MLIVVDHFSMSSFIEEDDIPEIDPDDGYDAAGGTVKAYEADVTCYYNYVNNTTSCANYANAKNAVTQSCNESYNDYISKRNAGLLEEYYGGFGSEYSSINECVSYFIGSQPTNSTFQPKMNRILELAGLTSNDLNVLK